MKFSLLFLYLLSFYILPVSIIQAEDLVEVYNVAVKNDPELLAAEVKHKAVMQEFPIAKAADLHQPQNL